MNIISGFLKDFFKKKNSDLEKIKTTLYEQFHEYVGYRPNFENPQSFNEKIQWLKLYYHDPLMTKCADKYEVRNYVKEKIGQQYLIKLLGVYNSPEKINFKELPSKFVLKVNHGSGQNIICKNKNTLDISKTKKTLSEWLKNESNHYFYSYEWCYKSIKPLIICEEMIGESLKNDLVDYKFMCFNGKVEMFFVCSDRQKGLKVDFFDLNWNKMPFIRYYENSSNIIKKPKNFDKMIRLSEVLSKPFPFVRVDFYEANDNVYFGEMTFYPGNGMEPFTPVEWDYKIGDLIKLPSKIC
ncbi:MAG: ATP-grasp fold amidoligase family protein [Minisyncoccia bacterium]